MAAVDATRTARPLRFALTPAQRRRNRQGDQVATALLVGMWAYIAGTPILGRFLGIDLDMVGELFIACLTLAATAVVVVWFADLVEAGLWLALAMVAPTTYVLVRALYAGIVDFHGITVIVVTLAIAAARPRAGVLRVLAILIVVAAVASVVLGFLRPDLAIQSENGVVTERADKQILPSLGLLLGFMPHANAMGQFVAMGLPLVLMLRRTWVRLVAIAVILFVLAWTAARGSLATAGVVLVLMLVLPAIRSPRWRSWAERGAVAAVVAVGVALPWVLRPEDGAFSARGGIWRVATEVWWTENPLFGLGPDWFERMATESSSPIIAAATTGHSQFVHLAVTGGAVLLVLATIQFVTFMAATTGPRARHDVVATLMVTAIVVNGWLEVSMGYIDSVVTWPVTFPILATLLFCRDRKRPRVPVVHGTVAPAVR